MGMIFGVTAMVSLITDIFRALFFSLDAVVYGLIPVVYDVIYSLYDFSTLFKDANTLTTIVKNMSSTIYSFLAIFMFFRTAFSLITMLVDPSIIDDKERGAKKIVTNIMICLLLIVIVPYGFRYAKMVQTRIMDNHLIEKVVTGNSYENDSYDLGNELALSVWSVFIHPNIESGKAVDSYNAVFNSGNTKIWPVGELFLHLNDISTGNLLTTIIGKIQGTATYDLAYVWLLSTLVGIYILWIFIKLMIDVGYRSIKFFALEILSPIAIISYIDPSSGKKGVFNKWLNETFKTYISLFVRVFVFALTSVILRSFSFSDFGADINVRNIVFLLAIIAFIKTAPKFIDNIFGTTISKDSDSKFASDMFRGLLGGAAIGTAGMISGAHVARRTGQNMFKGALSGGWTGATKGYNAAKKGDIPGVISAGTSTYSGIKKKYGYEFDAKEEQDMKAMERYVPIGKKAKNDAISKADANNREDIKKEFNRDGKPARKVNGYEVKYSNLFGDANAEGAYKKYVATQAENSVIGLSEEGQKIYNNAAQRKMYATLSKMQSSSANESFNVEYSAFAQKDAAGREAAVIDAFNTENARRAAAGEKVYADWQSMYKEIGGLEPSATISADSAFKIALDNKIKVETGHTTSEWANIAGKDEADASAASDEVKRYESSSSGKADKRRKDLYSKVKGKVEAQGYKPL